ncbi:ankyrin repeat-containing domain protein [Dissophora ornata]|nr:ankyrin repeat-containing domain protein [Dissophora ornata]
MAPPTTCVDHNEPGHVCNHGPSSFSEDLDEIEFSRSIHAACIANNLTRIQTILSKGSSQGASPANSLDSSGYTALHYASRAGNKEICTLLLNAGGEVDAKTPELGATPLMRAVQQNHLIVARLLVSYGANVEECNSDQENVFHIAAKAAKRKLNDGDNNTEAFVALVRWLRVKANIQDGRAASMLQARDTRGQTPVECLGDLADFPALAAVLSG